MWPQWVCILCIVAAAAGEWQLDISPLPVAKNNGGDIQWRIDVSGPETLVKSAILCATDAPIVPGATCSSPGMFRTHVANANRTMVVSTQPGSLYYLIDVLLPSEQCVRELPTAVVDEVSLKGPQQATAIGEHQQQPQPWYYYTIVIAGCCIVGAAFIIVVLGVWKGKQYPFSASFVDAYQSRKRRNQQLAAQTLGLHQYDPLEYSLDE